MDFSSPALNVLPEPKRRSVFNLFAVQFKSFLILLLFLAAGISFLFGDFLDGVLILLIVVINAALGFFQEFKAKRDVEAIQKMVVLTTRVIREGKEIQMETKFLVPGDVVIVEAGDRIPADGEILEGANLMVDEAVLTGESASVSKGIKDEVFFGTAVLSGRGKFLVTKIGAETRFGTIAKNLDEVVEEKTPLEIKIAKLSKMIGVGAICLIGLICLIGVAQGESLYDTFFSGVALAVAAVPEGLPAVLTIALAVGARKLAKRKTIVKRLAVTETLGSVDVILSDKTGTLTRNEMSVKETIIVGDDNDFLKTCVLCNSSALVGNNILGDTTEGALLKYARDKGINYEEMREENPITKEMPFDAKTRIMTVFTGNDFYSKGAIEKILENTKGMEKAEKKKYLDEANRLASKGLRILGLSKNNYFLGLLGIYDPPRDEAEESIRLCEKAGIRVVMATGDYRETALAIAKDIGLYKDGEGIVTGEQLASYQIEILERDLMNIRIFARVTPNDKLKIVEAYQRAGKVVAVTGDGVNDAPALKRAEVGVAMGITGTDVSKEAADLIITDDNFATIVAAVEEGRVIFANLLKSIKFLLASNLGEVLTVVGAILLGLPMPVSPLALLWINVVSDGLPAISLAVDTKEKDAFLRKPRQIGFKDGWFLAGTGSLIALGTLLIFYMFLPSGIETARLAAFSTIVFLDLVIVFVVRGRKQKLFANRFLIASVIVTVLIQIFIIATPEIRKVFV